MPDTVIELHYLGESDAPRWCPRCMLPSALNVHYVLAQQHHAPDGVHTVTVCDCGWQHHG